MRYRNKEAEMMGAEVRVEVEDPKALAGKTIVGERVPIGAPGDYKPCVAKLPSGELVLCAFLCILPSCAWPTAGCCSRSPSALCGSLWA